MAVKVRQRKGAWWIFIDHHGKRKAKRIGSSKRAAEIAAEKIQANIALGQFALVAEKKTPTLFADYAREWLSTYATVRCKPSSVREYEVVLSRYLTPIFGDTPLPTITREEVKRAVVVWMTGKASRTATLSRARLYAILRLLGGILTSAVEDGKIVANPAAKPGRFLPPKPHVKEHIRALTREELALLLRTIQRHWPAHFPFFLTLARAGLRLGEALALQWGDLDWQGSYRSVSGTPQRRAQFHKVKEEPPGGYEPSTQGHPAVPARDQKRASLAQRMGRNAAVGVL
jgi:integrase